MKYASLLLLFLSLAGTVVAQQKKDSVSVKAERAALKKEMGLSKKQAKEIKSVRTHYNSRLKAIAADSTLSKEQQKQQKRQLLKERQQKTDSLLTPEQRTKARELMKQRKKGSQLQDNKE
jgi:hypothetical protein